MPSARANRQRCVSLWLPIFPITGRNDLRLGRQLVHDVDPAGGLRAVIQLRRIKPAVVEARIALQTVHVWPIFDGDLDQFGFDNCVALRLECGETVACVVERTGDGAGLDADGILTEAVVAFAGHQCAVNNEVRMLRERGA